MGGKREWGIWLLILGVGSFVLPMILPGWQFFFISIFGPYSVVAGGVLAVLGLILVILSFREGAR